MLIQPAQFLQLILVALCLSSISMHPAIRKDSRNLQSVVDYSTDTKSHTLPDAATTIEQVQKILQADPSLPRLTKGEIEDLFEQVTREEYEKSLQVGDVQRANNMRALMLVLPYNTENTTDEVLQELYTRPPITKVIESYSSPQPQKFQSSASTTSGKVEIIEIGNLAATTYKPNFQIKEKINAKPTTYHPPRPVFKPIQKSPDASAVPVTSLPLLPDIEEEENKVPRYSSSYSARNPDWSLLEGEFNNRINFNQKFQPMPDLAGIFKTMGLDQDSKNYQLNEYQTIAKPSISSNIRQTSLGNIDITDFTRTLPPRPHLEAYSEFKPLNIGEEIRVQPDIEDYLNRFGIVNRKRKQIKPEDVGDSKNDKKAVTIKEQAIRRIDTDIEDPEPKTNNEDQLNKLLNNLQELERLNVSLASNMLKSIQTSNSSSVVLGEGPDPIAADEESRKNDLKRQSADESSTAETTLEASSTSPTTDDEDETPTDEPKNGSLADLEDSFGGPDPITEDPSPPPKKNGFYFLADWNSFLEVGEEGNDQVVVRFNPKIGDPRRFLKVTVP
ncbi:uncharacterized protein LOC129948238 [Eupeodes corollae]|uniref:uncharacterized protein LOC129948238 n=1 Tax=Eupeodes corollae TaxID=290404 RepID=UPI00249083E9|nr:uncharacterized protein LOC129948238 [Eupeodes corollae]XP_055915131.1 uncharacterized protein LOC129948238 [Eupeodes corollae]XP_055915132.1 uncharacterized protein LOC129948238 [Eupeodes corollae]